MEAPASHAEGLLRFRQSGIRLKMTETRRQPTVDHGHHPSAFSRFYRNKRYKSLLFLLLLTVPVKFIINTFDLCADVLFIYRVKIRENEFSVINAGYFYVIVCVLILCVKSVLRSVTRRFTKNDLSLTEGSDATESLFVFSILNFG